jgi:hypothetical protein
MVSSSKHSGRAACSATFLLHLPTLSIFYTHTLLLDFEMDMPRVRLFHSPFTHGSLLAHAILGVSCIYM